MRPMNLKSLPVLLLAFALASAALSRGAEPAPSGEERVRDALRQTMLQLRTAQADLAALQAGQAALEEERRSAAEKYEALKKQVAADRAALDKHTSGLEARVAELKTALAQRTADLEQATAVGGKAVQSARETEAAVAKLQAENLALQRRVADRETKNLALFLLGNEILGRYEEFSLGNALRAKEPFVGLTRTKLENLVQDYQDKLGEQRVKP
jgi:chromosome segregation ATPase